MLLFMALVEKETHEVVQSSSVYIFCYFPRRIINARDLGATEGIYHVDCWKGFILIHESITLRSSGRSKEEYVSKHWN